MNDELPPSPAPAPKLAPKPVRGASKNQLLALAVVGILIAVTGFMLVKKVPEAPDALPVTADGSEPTLPIPSSTEIAKNYGGLTTNTAQQSLVTRVGNQVASKSDAAKAGVSFRFLVLADKNKINVFATPDGTVFITSLLLNRLKTEGQLAGMLAHEIAQITNKNRPKYLATGVIVYTPEQEDKADRDGVKFMSQAGYDPTAFVTTLMMIRDVNAEYAVEFFQSHPSPVNRVAHIDYAIRQIYPEGVPESLSD